VLAVEVEMVTKQFRRQTVQPSTTLKTAVVDLVQRRRRHESDATFQALRGITLSVERGKTLGIIGRNGSGKSTLLKLLAGIYRPDVGRIAVYGKVGALLELGAGFHPEFSGRENVFINGIVLGLSKREVRRRFEEIVRFAELEAFIDEPVKTYSSGMYTRLGFSVATHADPDILLIDEILAVGDEAFRQKCLEKMAELRRRQKTIILVSHDFAAIERWSDEVLWLEDGVIREQGTPRRVIDLYRKDVTVQEGKAAIDEHHRIEEGIHKASMVETANRWGSQEVELDSVKMVDATGQERYVYRSGEQVQVILHYTVHHNVEQPVFGIALHRADGLLCYGSNTDIEGLSLPHLGQQGVVEVLIERLDFIPGVYYLNVAVHARDGHPYDFHHWLYSFAVESEIHDVGVCRLPHRWSIKALRAIPYFPAVSK
jgi:lipopolysaccharide transport system ATP-binding protein